MIIRSPSSWQTLTADLALILFLVTAQALSDNAERDQPTEDARSEGDEAIVEPNTSSALAVHRPRRGEDISQWLAATVTDQRQVATISVSYAEDDLAQVLAEGQRLISEAEALGVSASLIARPGITSTIIVTVDYRRDPTNGTIVAW